MLRSFQRLARAHATSLLGLAVACAASRIEQRPAPAAEAPLIPVTEASVAEAPVADDSVAATSLVAAPVAQQTDPEQPPARPVDPLERVLVAAREELGKRGGRRGIDCSMFVRRAYLAAGVDLMTAARHGDNGVQAIHRYVRARGHLYRRARPSPGDLVFFDNSYDRNRNRLLDDRLTHLGIVEEVLPDGTALILHSTNHGVVREPMNLLHPHAASDADGRAINAALRRRTSHDTKRTPHLLGELFAGFGTIREEAPAAQPAARRTSRPARTR